MKQGIVHRATQCIVALDVFAFRACVGLLRNAHARTVARFGMRVNQIEQD